MQLINQSILLTSNLTNQLLKMYIETNSMSDARQLFSSMQHNTVACNIMMAANLDLHQLQDTVSIFRSMKVENIPLNVYSYYVVLTAFAESAAFEDGNKLYQEILHLYSGKPPLILQNCALRIYAKSGECQIAEEFFEKMAERDDVTWNIMLGAYATNGDGKGALAFFQKILANNIAPTEHTFTLLLTSFSHAGLNN